MPLNTQRVEEALKRLAGVKPGDKVHFGGPRGANYPNNWFNLEVDRKGLFQGLGRGKDDSIASTANQKALADIIMAGAEGVMCGRIDGPLLGSALTGLRNLTDSYQPGCLSRRGTHQRHDAANKLFNVLSSMVRNLGNLPCLALVSGRTEDLTFDSRTAHPAPFATWFQDVQDWMMQAVPGSDWREYDPTVPGGFKSTDDDKGFSIRPFLGHKRINPTGTGYPLQTYKDAMPLTIESVAFDLDRFCGKPPQFSKPRCTPIPEGVVEELRRKRANKGMIYAALLMSHQSTLPGAMAGVTQKMNLLSNGVIIPPAGVGHLHFPDHQGFNAFHIDTSIPYCLTVTYVMEMTHNQGKIMFGEYGGLTPLTEWVARAAVQVQMSSWTEEKIGCELKQIRFQLKVS
jgi:hypothetical protein